MNLMLRLQKHIFIVVTQIIFFNMWIFQTAYYNDVSLCKFSLWKGSILSAEKVFLMIHKSYFTIFYKISKFM